MKARLPNIGFQRTARLRLAAAEAGSFGAKWGALVVVLVAVAAPVAAQKYALRKDADALVGSKITIYRLNDNPADKIKPEDERFYRFRVVCKKELNEAENQEFLALVSSMASRQEEELKEPGVPGGVPGCIGWGFGFRFETGGKVIHAFACLRCGWMFSADPNLKEPRLLYVFSKSDTSNLNTFFKRLLPCFGGVD